VQARVERHLREVKGISCSSRASASRPSRSSTLAAYPLVTARPRRCVRDDAVTEELGGLPRAAGDEADEHHLEAVKVRAALAMAVERMLAERNWEQRLHELPDGV
jgi:hypothetical protein